MESEICTGARIASFSPFPSADLGFRGRRIHPLDMNTRIDKTSRQHRFSCQRPTHAQPPISAVMCGSCFVPFDKDFDLVEQCISGVIQVVFRSACCNLDKLADGTQNLD